MQNLINRLHYDFLLVRNQRHVISCNKLHRHYYSPVLTEYVCEMDIPKKLKKVSTRDLLLDERAKQAIYLGIIKKKVSQSASAIATKRFAGYLRSFAHSFFGTISRLS